MPPNKHPGPKENKQPATDSKSTTHLRGQAILDCLRAILKRCEEAGVRFDYPGEGGERPFRGWLVSDLLTKVLGWPAEKIIVGERFDLLFQDADRFPVITIETKTPYHKATKKEREDFEGRLSGYGTLRTAYFTNGTEWERLDILAPAGELQIRERFTLELDTVTPEEAEAFFSPLFADRHFREVRRASRLVVSRENPHILKSLAADLDQAIGDLAGYLHSLFAGLREGLAGEKTRSVTIALFNLWCEKSLIVPPGKAADDLADRCKRGDLSPRDATRVFSDLGLAGAGANKAAEGLLTLAKSKRQDPSAVVDVIWPAYEQAIDKLCAQTGHVVLARSLLYRVGEDQNVFPRILSGESLEQALATRGSAVPEKPLPATDLLARVRLSMDNFLPTVYKLGEFDWWLVPAEKRVLLNTRERSWLRDKDSEFERMAQGLFRMLDGYSFQAVDVDVWRNVYQHYLPPEERQRIGGFYTPDELVHLILDLLAYTSKLDGLCKLSFIDPACGSGAFVAGALGRLLAHLELPLTCHEDIHKRPAPEWKRAEKVMNIVGDCLHAVDLHPFAAFLTTLNVLFLLLPLYVKAREKNEDFTIDLHIFSADSLEKHEADLHEPDLFSRLNSRVQLTEESFHHYQEMLKKRFDRAFGNPPWGGVLKGPLAPVYDTVKKERFAREFPAAAQGKYDVYGLFIERVFQILKPGGRFGLITQGSFIDKEWAAGLRELLSTKATLHYIIDLNPFGHLFFRAMNTPCITVADNLPTDDGEVFAILSTRSEKPEGDSENERRAWVTSTIRRALGELTDGKKKAQISFAAATRVSQAQLRETAGDRWNLAGHESEIKFPRGWKTVIDLLEPSQGVTVGGEGCLEIILMSPEEAKRNHLEADLVHPVIKGLEIKGWALGQPNKCIFYPYELSQDKARPAFSIELDEVKDSEIREALRQSGVRDGLDFDRQVDRQEREIVRRNGVNRGTVGDLLRHRATLDLIKYPGAAAYLTQHYEKLEGRIFKQKNVRDFKRQWYEYIWPRKPHIMLAKPKVITPRLTRRVRFALDSDGVVPQDSCISLAPTEKTREAWNTLGRQLAEVLARNVMDEDVLKYCLAFLNSKYSQERLTTGRRPTPKGSYAITEEYLAEIPIPPPNDGNSTNAMLGLVSELVTSNHAERKAQLEGELAKLVDRILQF